MICKLFSGGVVFVYLPHVHVLNLYSSEVERVG